MKTPVNSTTYFIHNPDASGNEAVTPYWDTIYGRYFAETKDGRRWNAKTLVVLESRIKDYNDRAWRDGPPENTGV